MARILVVGIISLLAVMLFVRQIVNQLRSGRFRLRGSTDYKTRKNNPIWFWSSIASQIVLALIFLYFFSQAFLKVTK